MTRKPSYSKVVAAVIKATKSQYHNWTILALGGVYAVAAMIYGLINSMKKFNNATTLQLQQNAAKLMQASTTATAVSNRINSLCAAIIGSL